MKNIIISILIVLSIFTITSCKNNNEKIKRKQESMKIIINDKEYPINLENNDTTKEEEKQLISDAKIEKSKQCCCILF